MKMLLISDRRYWANLGAYLEINIGHKTMYVFPRAIPDLDLAASEKDSEDESEEDETQND